MKQLLYILIILSSSSLYAQLTISEIMFEEPSWESDFKYFELYNISDSTINISEWTISGDINLPVMPDLNLEPDQRFLFCDDLLAILNHGIIMDLASWGDFNNLSNEPTIILKDPSGAEVVRIEYEMNSEWPMAEPGVAIELCGPDLDPSIGSNWALSENEISANGNSIFGTPGSENGCIQVSTDNLFNTDEIKLYPNPCHSILNIEYDGNMESLAVYNIYGVKLKNATNPNQVDVSELTKGVYLIGVESKGNKKFQQFVKL